jgi:hypothetical protein
MNNEEIWLASDVLLDRGVTNDIPRELDDDHRLIPIGVDIDRDVAATAFVAWLPGDDGLIPGLRMMTFRLDDSRWCPSGGSSAPMVDYPVTDRRAASLNGSVLRWLLCSYEGSGRCFGAVLQATAEVGRLQIGTRFLNVPRHGYVALAARTRRRAIVTALDDGGSPLGILDLSRDGTMGADQWPRAGDTRTLD